MEAALQALVAIGQRRGRRARTGRRARRDARAGRVGRRGARRGGQTGRATGRAPAPGGRRGRARRAPRSRAERRTRGRERSRSSWRTTTRRVALARRARARPATWCSSRPRAAPGSTWSPTALLDARPGERCRVRAILLSGGLALVFTLLGTVLAIRVLVAEGLRPADPRRRPDHPPHQARHADHGRHRHHPLRRPRPTCSRRSRPRACPRPPGCCCCSCFVGLGARRLPRRLHQDRQAAQPRPAQPGQDDRPGARRDRVRRCWRCSSPTSAGRPRPRGYLSFTRDWEAWTLPTVLVVLLILLMIAGTSNAVNLTDGLDGLATGASTMVFARLHGR